MPKEVMGFSLDKEVANELRKRYPSNMSYFVNKILRASLFKKRRRSK